MKLFPYPQEKHIAYLMLCMIKVTLHLLDAKHFKKIPLYRSNLPDIYIKKPDTNINSAMLLVE